MHPDRTGIYHNAEADLRRRLMHDVYTWTGAHLTQGDTLMGWHRVTRDAWARDLDLDPRTLGGYRQRARAAEVLGQELSEPPPWRTLPHEVPGAPWFGGEPPKGGLLEGAIAALRRAVISDALAWTRGRQAAAAGILEIDPLSMARWSADLEISYQDYREPGVDWTYESRLPGAPWMPAPKSAQSA